METKTAGQIEDRYTGAIESQTSKLPSSIFLGLAIGSMAASAILKITGKDDWALFVGQWAAPFLIIGNYNKMVKQHGSDARSRWAAYKSFLNPGTPRGVPFLLCSQKKGAARKPPRVVEGRSRTCTSTTW